MHELKLMHQLPPKSKVEESKDEKKVLFSISCDSKVF